MITSLDVVAADYAALPQYLGHAYWGQRIFGYKNYLWSLQLSSFHIDLNEVCWLAVTECSHCNC